MKISNVMVAVFVCFLSLFSKLSFADIGSCPDPSAYPNSGCSVEGVRPSGFPYFDQLVRVRYNETKDGFNINANYYQGSFRSHLYINPLDIFDISKTKFKLQARVRDGVATGTVSIRGRIDELGITNLSDPLMMADLSGEWGFSDDGTLIGFNTENLVCHDMIIAYLSGGCTQNESVYLSLLESITTGERNIRTTGVAVTTIPVPGAVWLFGSGLLALMGITRRRERRLCS